MLNITITSTLFLIEVEKTLFLSFQQHLKGLVSRLRPVGNKESGGKQRNQIEEDILGKRCDYSAWGVIAPDPTLELGEIGIPEQLRFLLLVPQPLAMFNRQFLQDCVINGPDCQLPKIGASFVKQGHKEYPHYIDGNDEERMEAARKLRLPRVDESDGFVRPPDVVYRHLKDGDWIALNKNPSLRKENLLGFKVRIVPGSSLLLNPQACTPLHADFDGDKVNIFLCKVDEQIASDSMPLFDTCFCCAGA